MGVLLGLAMLACNAPTGARPAIPTEVPPTATPPPPTQEPASDNTFSFTFTEAELTDLAAEQISEAELEGATLSDIRIELEDGQILAYTTVRVEFLEASGVITAVPSITAEGTVDVEISSAEFGLFDLDPSTLDEAEVEIETALNDALSEYDSRLTAISITDGEMTVTGTLP